MTPDPIARIDEQWNVAYQTNDRAVVAHILADEWTAIDARGQQMTKADLLAQMSAVPWPFATAQFQTISRWETAALAVVIDRLYGHGTVEHQTLAIDQYYTRIYSMRDHRWQAVATQVTTVQPAPLSQS